MKKKEADVAKAKAKSKAKSKTKVKPVVKTKSSKAKPAKKAAKAAKSKTAPKMKKAATVKSNKSLAKQPAIAKGSKVSPKTPVSHKTSKLVDVSQFVTPLDNRLIVQLKASERVTAGGLIIPDTVTDVSGHREGIVISVGRGHRDEKGRLRPMDVQKGDRILFSSMSANSKFQYQSEELIILRETDVMGVLS